MVQRLEFGKKRAGFAIVNSLRLKTAWMGEVIF